MVQNATINYAVDVSVVAFQSWFSGSQITINIFASQLCTIRSGNNEVKKNNQKINFVSYKKQK